LRAAACLLILAAGAWSYATSFQGVFVLDDMRAIVRNETIRSLWPLRGPLSPAPRSTVAGRPVANLSFAVNYALAPAPSTAAPAPAGAPAGSVPVYPAPFHAGNLIIHLAAALTLAGVVRRTLLSARLAPVFEAAADWIALAVALVWVTHPLQTAAVTYVVQRVESLMGLFYLLTLYCSIRAFERTKAGWWEVAAIASCALGMATKEVMVTAPLIVAIWWRLFAPARPGVPRRRGLPLLAGVATTWVVLALLVSGERRGPSLSTEWDIVWRYLLAQAEIIVHYVRLAFVPSSLVFLYDWPLGTSLGAVAWQVLLLTVLVALTAIGISRRHPASFVGAWFFLILAPSSSVLPIVTEVAAEHRMYLPLAAVVSSVVVGVFLLGQRLVPSAKARAVAAAVAVAVGVGVLGAETRDRNRVYWSAVGLWQDTVAKRPNDSRARVAYGEALADAGRLAEAEAQLRAGISMAPNDPNARVRLGAVLAQQGRFDEALPQLERTVTLRPDDVDAHRFLGEIYAMRGRETAAVRHLEQALAIVPRDVRVLARLAAILVSAQDPSVRNAPRARQLAGWAQSWPARDPVGGPGSDGRVRRGRRHGPPGSCRRAGNG